MFMKPSKIIRQQLCLLAMTAVAAALAAGSQAQVLKSFNSSSESVS